VVFDSTTLRDYVLETVEDKNHCNVTFDQCKSRLHCMTFTETHINLPAKKLLGMQYSAHNSELMLIFVVLVLEEGLSDSLSGDAVRHCWSHLTWLLYMTSLAQ